MRSNIKPRAARMSVKAFNAAVHAELNGNRCLHVPRLAPFEYAGGIRYGSVRSIKFEFPETRVATSAVA